MPKLTTMGSHPRADERRVWTERAAAKQRQARSRRRSELAAQERPIADALDLLARERDNGVRTNYVEIRPELLRVDRVLVVQQADPALRPRRGEANPELVAHNRAALGERPPLARLVNRPGLAVPLELTALCVASFRAREGEEADFGGIDTVGRSSWATAVADRDLDAPSRARRHIVDALRRLSGERLVQLPPRTGSHQAWEGWSLLREDGDGSHEYTVPRSGLSVPVDFWLKGWVAVLTPPELVAYLMIRNQADLYPSAHEMDGIGLSPRLRRQQYGVTPGVYATLNELTEFGLLKRVARSNPAHSPREVTRYQLREQGLREPAFRKVIDVLKSRPTPARIDRHDGRASWVPAQTNP